MQYKGLQAHLVGSDIYVLTIVITDFRSSLSPLSLLYVDCF